MRGEGTYTPRNDVAHQQLCSHQHSGGELENDGPSRDESNIYIYIGRYMVRGKVSEERCNSRCVCSLVGGGGFESCCK